MERKLSIIQSLFVAAFLFLAVSCNAPRNNPLDPNNSENKLFTISGTIYNSTAPPQSLADVTLFWKNENIFTRTNTSGSFALQISLQKNGWLLIEKDGFNNDSVFISWNNEKTISVQKYLNAIPHLDSILTYSIVKNKYSNVEYQLVFEAQISDDDDVDSVFIQNDALQILEKLNGKSYFMTLYGSDLRYTIVSSCTLLLSTMIIS